MEYKTTVGDFRPHPDVGATTLADHPTPPEGEGWELIGSAASQDPNNGLHPEGVILWFWKRDKG
jgi:hypothetical protein